MLRGGEEDVLDEDVSTSTTLTGSVRMLLAFAIDRRGAQYTVFTTDVKPVFFNANMKDGNLVFAKLPLV